MEDQAFTVISALDSHRRFHAEFVESCPVCQFWHQPEHEGHKITSEDVFFLDMSKLETDKILENAKDKWKNNP